MLHIFKASVFVMKSLGLFCYAYLATLYFMTGLLQASTWSTIKSSSVFVFGFKQSDAGCCVQANSAREEWSVLCI